MPNKDRLPKVTKDSHDLVVKYNNIEKQIKETNNPIEKIKLGIEKAKVTIELSKTDIRKY